MNPNKIEENVVCPMGPPPPHHEQFLDPQSQPSIDDDAFSLTGIDFFRDDDDDDISHASSDAEFSLNGAPSRNPNFPDFAVISGVRSNKRAIDYPRLHISAEPYISSQFYTFNKESHALMIQCLIEGRVAKPDEIRAVTPDDLLASWRSVWKDRNQDTAYLTAWKRIQDKLTVHVADPASAVAITGNSRFLCFKNNLNQFVSHVDQWQDIVMSFHGVEDLRHLGLRETIEKIKQVWTVGAKFYGIPETYIRTCVAACLLCANDISGCAPRSKRRKFEYTESFDLPAKAVPFMLQQLAVKHKVVLCIRQKYIRHKPFMAEVKDYACHRAGEPASLKKSRIMKREPYVSKRCGCGFRIRAIVPISNYNERDKTFVYEDEGTAVFKLCAVHSGHVPGPLDGNARIMHRMVGHKGSVLMDNETMYGVVEEGESDDFGFLGNDPRDLQHLALQHVQELRKELGLLEGQIRRTPPKLLRSLVHELSDMVGKLRNAADDGSKSVGLPSEKQHLGDVLVVEHDLPDWGDVYQLSIYGDGNDVNVFEDDGESFGRTLGEVTSWDQMAQYKNKKNVLVEACKEEKWLKCGAYDEKGIVGCSDYKLNKLLSHEMIDPDLGLGSIQVDDFYAENPKWFDSPCELNPSADRGDGGFQPGGIA
ncbi:uncharacterized protein LOC111373382 isoform X1 [Olea europaea var. sylvestris]|uniref:Uncharacterized protein n=1 Tax=Olea europaea subsp. europaea TaxID=158383 RepID=A0A8S0RSQ4_OLEEU|nr:uncharacterized protein LOC111373382 isoform X1 [Olea europaea var. sylvestris]XP_022851667.1 uncharacterized protein LOC111373382 isoform X1 [Olea europaea var. sylvestris]XP_022851668.1 uncharacterized protein LOC111373382 isoform X1 [Olea europaea var. sylvestris]XP_022851669.1 uncharacterized protein LOC111373382 isoform X1 [Olea europaea var. sylvestris]XP_022851670.1 uncharacterized protein LOC111373382 isoform X1 [Olea europaea var. sylvestris]XP_022851671.1 uncharacterized protein L